MRHHNLTLFTFLLLFCSRSAAQLCNNSWLSTPSNPSYAEVGDLNVTGNTITVEAVFNRTTAYFGGPLYAGDLVSKHNTPADVNYLLRPNSAEITTDNGYFIALSNCEIELNKTYHVALVYDGSTLKFYRNGFLMSQVAATGNLVQNSWKTRIGYYEPQAANTNFIGYTNEVRIWDIARTQTEIQNYMSASLPNPASQAGLKGYYTFDNLLNKQGNPAFNGTLGGGASIASGNSNCAFLQDSCAVPASSCNNWLGLPSTPSFFSIGDLDITGDKVTLEAVFYRTSMLSNGTPTDADIISKHQNPSDVNYLLRPAHALITTSNGFFVTPDVCDYELNKWYHVAMVYDGSTLKFYRNGFLLSQVTATGNLVQNDWLTQIGIFDSQVSPENFIGFINEARIWNVARTAAEIRTYMNTSLPNPTTQTGLQAYYTFDNLLNKQGNAAWNGTLGGAASINATVPNCSFLADSCLIPPVDCSNWMHIPNYNTQDYVSIGDLDVTGDKITVEALFNADTNYFIPSTISYDLVSKHTDPSNSNYLLRPVTAEITTTNGFTQVIACDYVPKKIHHAALVYDGSTLKFYRNGFLMGSKPASGNLVQNDLITKIGNYSTGTLNGSLKGFMNEVRIWNVARTQSELKTYMFTSLPNPTTQPGLLAYYTFDNLDNKQGNAAWNGTLHGAATINNPVPSCALFADSCKITSVLQTCNGSLGSPIVNIDFGSGAANPGPQLPVAVPGASTNYNFAGYATGNPPSAAIDGDYALLNAVPVNSAWFTGATDHTGNTNGYMAFFNSAPSPGEFYRQTVNSLCPGTTYEFSAWIANVINNSILPAGILPNITFKILDPVTQTELASYNTGDIPNLSVMTWKQYSFLFTLPATNSSVTLVLANNNIGGNAQPGNDLAIDDITFRPCGPLTNASFSSTLQVDSTAIAGCNSVDLFGSITGSFNNPAYQWQISSDGGNTYSDISGANTLVSTVNNLSDGVYAFRLLSAESGNISSINCRFISNIIKLTVTGCTSAANSIILNDYAAVLSLDPCTNQFAVDDASMFNAGDTVVMMQMKGAAIDSTNSTFFGNISNYNNAGSFEFNYVKSKTGNTIELLNSFLKQYDAANGKVQLIRVPYYQTLTITDTVTCLPWNGSKGGVVILNSATDIVLNAPVDASNKGFRGGAIGAGFSCNNTTAWAVAAGTGGTKGESITEYIPGLEAGGAHMSNGGGGAYSANTGGGGGSNFGAGGIGGNQSNTCLSQTQSIGGETMDVSTLDRVFMGGGGGGGQQDDGQPVAAGGNGGGIIILKATTITGNNQFVKANGETITTLVRDEGGAGGGAGGSILFYALNFTGNLFVEANGGDGSSNNNQVYPSRCHGPGGGGGGGYLGFTNGPVPPGVTASLNGGIAGFILNPASVCFNTTHGAADGESGGSNFGIVFPAATVPFKKNIDSVRFSETATTCKTYNFNGIAYTNTAPVQNWQWDFGDASFANGQSSTHTYATGGTFPIKLVITDINGCKDSTEKIINPAGINFDFVFEQDACNPRSVIFKAIGDTTAEIFWGMGDATFINNIRNPQHTYADTGYYLVQYSTGNGPCIDTVRKIIYIGYQNSDIIATPDTTICFGSSKLLRSRIDSTVDFCWSPASFLNSINLANPTTSTPQTITYSLTAFEEAGNLITNGSFSDGNAGFTADFTLFASGAGIIPPGSYGISNTTINAGIGAVACIDHTDGTGNMLIVNSDAANKTVWKQKVPVIPNTNYIFSCWIQSVNPSAFSTLQFYINGNKIPDSINTPLNTCRWQRHFILWNSGNNTTAQLALVDKTIPKAIAGIDNFAIDDIGFSAFVIKNEQVKISVDTPFVDTRPDTAVCETIPVQLNTTGAVNYTWTPASGLSDPLAESPIALPVTTTKYFVSGTNANGCTAYDSVLITVKPKPIVLKTGDTIVCRNTSVPLFASGGLFYSWSPGASLNSTTAPNPVANPVNDTRYFVTVTGNNNCSSTDSVLVTIKPLPVFTISPSQSVCQGSPVLLNASGGNFYSWSPASLVSNPSISNPQATNSSITTTFSVVIKETTCNDSTLLNTTVTVLPIPTITVTKSNDINCAVGTAELLATGAQNYLWTPAAGLSSTTVAAPQASPANTITYTVKGSDANGCSNSATVTVLVDFTGKVSYAMPNAFTPNGDGTNDCFKIRYFGQVTNFQMSIYNRWGEKVFSTADPAGCWDGTFKGVPLDPGNYVYFLTAATACGPVERKGNVLLIR